MVLSTFRYIVWIDSNSHISSVGQDFSRSCVNHNKNALAIDATAPTMTRISMSRIGISQSGPKTANGRLIHMPNVQSP